MPPDPKPNASSIPIPDDFPRLFIRYGGSLGRAGRGHEVAVDVGDELISVADLPKLYAAWAEDAASKVETRLRSTFGLQDWHEDEIAELVIGLRAALGLGERT